MRRGDAAPDGGGRGYTYRVRRAQSARPWRNLLIGLVVGYAAFFDYGVFIAESGSGNPEAEGELMIQSCEPNWLVLGARSQCSGTVTPGASHLRAGASMDFESSFSRFEAEDVRHAIPVYDTSISDSGEQWRTTESVDSPLLAKLLIGPLVMIAAGYVFVGITGLVGRSARKIAGKAQYRG